MSFTIRSNFGGGNALFELNDENAVGRQSAIRLSLGLKVGPQKCDRSAPAGSSQSPARSVTAALLTMTSHRLNENVSIAATNFEAAAAEIIDVESAAGSADLAGLHAAEYPLGAMGCPQWGIPHNSSAYDLAPLASYAALKIG